MPSDVTDSSAIDCGEYSEAGEAFSEAVSPELATEPPSDDLRLSRVIAAWPALSANVKAAIHALVEQAIG